jgi:hypothetical protein
MAGTAFNFTGAEEPGSAVERLRNRRPAFNFMGAEEPGMDMAAALPEMQKRVAKRQQREATLAVANKLPMAIAMEVGKRAATGKYEGGKTRKSRKSRKTRKSKSRRRRY